MTNHPLYVTQPHLPPLEEFIPYLEQIWDSKILTNKGPFHQQLEQALCDYLGVNYLALFANGTLALVNGFASVAHQRRGDHYTLFVRGDCARAALEWY
jgi:dTDP-4-amino-4,6-dideoxygalactose transaminase